MDPANVSSALREAELDNAEGTDLNNGKTCRIKQRFPQIPLGSCQVSGEFPMIKAAAAQGCLDETAAMVESLVAIKLLNWAGADFIITYFAKELAKVLNRN
ncbi:hypothetical protein [Candidatus Coxiella mudrowiae]|uniref:hypothetical protein n=1 Tax=Candidatus Coxiella mudrowiae TaxID=2054173 RepID=UPI0027D21C80|nr:hypothetical protein [Candidatus Coxiella mudrowiae]